mgnify:CR=1 FL=1
MESLYLSLISYDQNSNEISFNGSENVDGPNFFLIRFKLVDSEDNESEQYIQTVFITEKTED